MANAMANTMLFLTSRWAQRTRSPQCGKLARATADWRQRAHQRRRP